MTEQHDLDELVPAGIDDGVEHGLRQLFAVARAPGTADELAAEAAVVASMSDIVRRQTAIGHVAQRRTPLRRVTGSRTAKVAMITGFVVVLTSAAVAAGVAPEPVQSVFDRAARIASWQNAEREEPDAAVRDDPEPRTTTEAIEVPDAIAPTTVAAYITVDRESDALALCGMWATSIRSGVELEADAKLALAAMTARAGAALDRLCGPAASPPDESVPAAQETLPPEAVLPPTVSTVDTTVPTTDAPPAATDDGTPKATPTLPPQANGNGPPVTEPGPVDTGNDAGTTGTPNANANPNASGGANANGGNPNANPHAGSANPNASGGANANGNADANGNGNGAGSNGNANGANQNSHGGNGNG